MAYQHMKRPEGMKINRTPAPKVTRNTGGTTYGQTSDVNTPSSVTPNNPAVISELGRNLMETGQDDGQDVLAKVISGGLRGDRPDHLPDISDEQRTISADSYPLAHGAVRQQNPDFLKSKTALPSTTKAGPDDSDQRRAMAVKRTQ